MRARPLSLTLVAVSTAALTALAGVPASAATATVSGPSTTPPYVLPVPPASTSPAR